jgi:hypothetical protein
LQAAQSAALYRELFFSLGIDITGNSAVSSLVVPLEVSWHRRMQLILQSAPTALETIAMDAVLSWRIQCFPTKNVLLERRSSHSSNQRPDKSS